MFNLFSDPIENINKSSTNKQLVAAIDFGTAVSALAFSFREDFELEPLRIIVQSWEHLACKTPTCALFDKNKTLIAFGYKAEKIFRELSENGKHEEHYLFERFKMQLYNKSGEKKKKVLNNLRQTLCS